MEHEMNDECKVGLGLGIGVGHVENRRRPPIQFHILFPPCPPPHNNIKQEEEDDDRVGFNKNGKRSKSSVDELEEYLEESVVQERVGASDARKKLRLNKDQTSVLEEAYQVNNTLTGMQKQELAEKLNLRPRQVEVWFQNRRARNKLKQTEVDFEMLKKWCDSLNNENRRLRKELQELKLIKQLESSTKVSSMALAAMTVCPSCMQTATSNTKMEADEDSSMAY